MKSKMLLAPGIRTLVLVKTRWVTTKKKTKRKEKIPHMLMQNDRWFYGADR